MASHDGVTPSTIKEQSDLMVLSRRVSLSFSSVSSIQVVYSAKWPLENIFLLEPNDRYGEKPLSNLY